jgi:hemoglobin
MMNNQSLFVRLGGAERLRLRLHHFYADVRQHRVIGPIFDKHVGNWPQHIATSAAFWTRITGGISCYAGNMPAKHLELELKQEHFKVWLTLWEANCNTHLPPTEAKEMVHIVLVIARRLQTILANGESIPSWRWTFPQLKIGGADRLQISTHGQSS